MRTEPEAAERDLVVPEATGGREMVPEIDAVAGPPARAGAPVPRTISAATLGEAWLAAAELILPGQQWGIMLGCPRVQAAAGFEIGCCACGHGALLRRAGIRDRGLGISKNPNDKVHWLIDLLFPNP